MLLTADTQSLKGAHFVRCAHLPFPYLQYQKDKLEVPKGISSVMDDFTRGGGDPLADVLQGDNFRLLHKLYPKSLVSSVWQVVQDLCSYM